MKTTIVNEAVAGRSVAVALKSGAYTVAGTGLCGLGSVLDTAADIGQKVVDATRAAGEACTAKGEEFLAEAAKLKGEEPAAKKEEEKVEAQAPKQQAAQTQTQNSNKTWTLADFVAQHNEFANAATAVIKEYTKVVFRAEGSVKGVVTAFDAVRRADGTVCSIFADMAKKTFSVIAPPKKEEKPAKKAAPKQEKATKKAAPAKKATAPAKETVKAETKTEEAKEVADMKAALEAARAKKAAAKAKAAKAEVKKEEKSSEKTAPAKKETKAEAKKEEKSSKKAEGKKEAYSSNPKADMALEEAVHDHGEWLDKVVRHFQSISTKSLSNVVVRTAYIKFSSYGENSQEDAVSVAFKSHKVKVNRKEVKLDL